ncbi:M24 family metallopeptidase [Terriglobus aquaticus]|uniref:M24 family metallopeptidase n=1 Tax=Terriglobus aquaticus TaxID=940139 RepID=A0ABW9KLU0_9BACT|nr:Xaa-Pro peptidase family protein [Terriglobus aquaticus]
MQRRRFLQSSLIATGAMVSDGLQAQRVPDHADANRALPPSIAALKNRKSEAVPISNDERARRVQRAQELLQQQKMGALLLAGGTSLVYFTGLRWGNSERMMAYVIPARGAAFIVCPFFEEARVRERLSTVPGGDTIRVYTWLENESPYKLVSKGLMDAGLRTGSLGIEEKTPFVFADGIAKACPGWHIVDGTPVSAGCRMIKSPAELALMRLANQVTFEVYEAAWKAGHPGMATSDFSALVAAAYSRVGFPGFASCETGIYSALPHGSVTPQVIRENDIVLIDDGCTVEGYYSDISRTFVYGTPTDKMQRVFEVVRKAQTAAREAAKSGNECQSVDAAARKVITDAGFGPDYKTFTHRLGHGIGMDMHEWTYLVRGNATPMQANMTFSDEPGIYLSGEFGVRLEDDMVVTPNGGEWFTPQSHSLTEPFAV